MLRQLANSINDGIIAAGVNAIVVKGPTFASRLYPEKSLRRFTDIDFLVEGSALKWISEALIARGFYLASGADASDLERKWLHSDHPSLMAEVQGDLVHAPSLRSRMTLKYSDLVDGGSPDQAERPAALLAVAVTHGAVHQFDQLVQVVDILQAARGLSAGSQEAQFENILKRTGLRFSAIASLNLAGHMFGEPRCIEIARGLGPARYTRLANLLVSKSVVVSTMDMRRPYLTWRRLSFPTTLEDAAERWTGHGQTARYPPLR